MCDSSFDLQLREVQDVHRRDTSPPALLGGTSWLCPGFYPPDRVDKTFVSVHSKRTRQGLYSLASCIRCVVRAFDCQAVVAQMMGARCSSNVALIQRANVSQEIHGNLNIKSARSKAQHQEMATFTT